MVYDAHKGKNLTGEITEHFSAFFLDPYADNHEGLLHEIVATIFNKEQEEVQSMQQQGKNTKNAIVALLAIGLGLAVLAVLSEE